MDCDAYLRRERDRDREWALREREQWLGLSALPPATEPERARERLRPIILPPNPSAAAPRPLFDASRLPLHLSTQQPRPKPKPESSSLLPFAADFDFDFDFNLRDGDRYHTARLTQQHLHAHLSGSHRTRRLSPNPNPNFDFTSNLSSTVELPTFRRRHHPRYPTPDQHRSFSARSSIPEEEDSLANSSRSPSQPSKAAQSNARLSDPNPRPSVAARWHRNHISHSRSLTDPAPKIVIQDEMMTFAQPPGSPPELTSSKSSKSSSFHSSSISGADGAVLADLAHFEDIGLDDDRVRSTQELYGAGSSSNNSAGGTKTNSRTLAGSAAVGRIHSPAMPAVRELVNGAAKSSPALSATQMQIQGRNELARRSNQSLGLPVGGRKSHASPSPSSSLAMTAMQNRSRSQSRSPSPTHMMQRPLSARPLSANASSLRSMPVIMPQRPRSRHGSSTKPRKTAKEIEDDFHDSDEDLPDDASLWNVPLSPGLFRTASSALTSANNSASTSPERPSHLAAPPTSNNGHLSTPRTAPPVGQSLPNLSSDIIPESPVRARAPRGSMPERIPDSYAFGKNRAKSWDNVLSELSEEAKSLSEALDAHAAEGDHSNEAGGSESGVDAIEKLHRAKTTSAIGLPPLRRNDVMIDPLPVSKEKEKVLSRTRPSWLPPKDRKEEKKHLKEYRRIMELSLEAEKRRIAKEASAKCARDDTQATLQRIWDEHILPNWDASIRDPRTRELWWRGIPASSRPEVWKRAITNELGLTATTYEKALARAKAVESPSSPIHSPASPSGLPFPPELAWLQAIRRDVMHTFPTLNLFQPKQPLHGALVDLLSAYAFYRSDVGYVHGSHLPAALLLLTLSSATDAFTALANLLNRPLPLSFMTGDPAGTGRTYELVLGLLRQKRPKLYHHLFARSEEGGLAMRAVEIVEPMVRTLFLNGCCEPPMPSSASGRPLSAPLPANGVARGGFGAGSLPSSPGFPPRAPLRPFSATPRSPAVPHFQPRPPPSPRHHQHSSPLPIINHPHHQAHSSSDNINSMPSSPASTSFSTAIPPSRGLSLALALRFWDVIVFDGDAAIIRACMAVLAARESALYGSREEVLRVLGWGGGLGLGGVSGASVAGVAGAGVKGAEREGEDETERVETEIDRIMGVVREVGKEAGGARGQKKG